MKKIIIYFVATLFFITKTLSGQGDCNQKLKEAYSYIVMKYCDYENNKSEKNVFYGIRLLKYDTLNCVLKINIISYIFQDDLEKSKGDLVYTMDSNLIVFGEESYKLRYLIDEKIDTVNSVFLNLHNHLFIRKKATSQYSNDNLGMEVEYRNGRITAWVGDNYPVYIFSKFDRKYTSPN